ncbi:hypothetical protein [Corynebacterium glucuronolyticum]|uniref:hypothetical protein n=1 Tax=Corynebacterium glucuronolyticum TaxID=39791 RepID=UPI001E57A281|nr:hypothetical protein [Corynebacterium glucuronolyticum]
MSEFRRMLAVSLGVLALFLGLALVVTALALQMFNWTVALGLIAAFAGGAYALYRAWRTSPGEPDQPR